MKKLAVIFLLLTSSALAQLEVSVTSRLRQTPPSTNSDVPLGYPNRDHILALPEEGAYVLYRGGSGYDLYLTYDNFSTWTDSIDMDGCVGGAGDHAHLRVVDSTIWISSTGSAGVPGGYNGVIRVYNGAFECIKGTTNPTLGLTGNYKHGGTLIPFTDNLDSAALVWRNGNTPRSDDISANWTTDSGATYGSKAFTTDMNDVFTNGARTGTRWYDGTLINGAYFRDSRALVLKYDRTAGTWGIIGDTLWVTGTPASSLMERWYDFAVLEDTIIYYIAPSSDEDENRDDSMKCAIWIKGASDWVYNNLTDTGYSKSALAMGGQLSVIESSGRMVGFWLSQNPSGNQRIYMRWGTSDSTGWSDSTYTIVGGDSTAFSNNRFTVINNVPTAHGDKTLLYYTKSGTNENHVIEISFTEAASGCSEIATSEPKWWLLDTCFKVEVDYTCDVASKATLIIDTDNDITGATRTDSVITALTDPDSLFAGGLTKNTKYYYWVEIESAGGTDTSAIDSATTLNADVYLVSSLPANPIVDNKFIRPHPDSQGVLNSDGNGIHIEGDGNILRGWTINFGNDSGSNYYGLYIEGSATGYGANGFIADSMNIFHAPTIDFGFGSADNQPISIWATAVRMNVGRDAIGQQIKNCSLMVKGRDSKIIVGSNNSSFTWYGHKIHGNIFMDSSEAFRRRDYFDYGSMIYLTSTSNAAWNEVGWDGWHWEITNNKTVIAPWVNLCIDDINVKDSMYLRSAYNYWFVDQVNRHDTVFGGTQMDSPAQGYCIAVRGDGHILIEEDTLRSGTSRSGGRGIFIVGIGITDHKDSAITIRQCDINVHQGWNGYDANTMGIEVRQSGNYVYADSNTIVMTRDSAQADFTYGEAHAGEGDTFDNVGCLVQAIRAEQPREGNGTCPTNARRFYSNHITIQCLDSAYGSIDSRWHYAAGIATAVTGEDTDELYDHRPPIYDSGNIIITDNLAYMFGGDPNGGVEDVSFGPDSIEFSGDYPTIEKLLAVGDYGAATNGGDSNFVRGMSLNTGSENDTAWTLQGGASAGDAIISLQEKLKVTVVDGAAAAIDGANVIIFNQYGDTTDVSTYLDSGYTDANGLYTSDWLSYFTKDENGVADTAIADYSPIMVMAATPTDTTIDTLTLRWDNDSIQLTLSTSFYVTASLIDTIIGEAQIEVDFGEYSGPDSVVLVIDGDNPPTTHYDTILTPTVPDTFVVTGLTAGGTYYAYAVGYDNPDFDTSAQISFVVPDTLALTASMSVIDTAYDSMVVTVTCTNVNGSDVDSIYITVSDVGVAFKDSTGNTTYPAAADTFFVTGLDTGTAYYFQVIAVDSLIADTITAGPVYTRIDTLDPSHAITVIDTLVDSMVVIDSAYGPNTAFDSVWWLAGQNNPPTTRVDSGSALSPTIPDTLYFGSLMEYTQYYIRAIYKDALILDTSAVTAIRTLQTPGAEPRAVTLNEVVLTNSVRVK